MKPAPFTYHRPAGRDEVDALLGDLGEDAKVLAGGQSLIPILNMRLASPAHIIDVNCLRDEPSDPVAADGWVTFGPLVRQEAAEHSPLVARQVPLLAEALRHVAHPAIRSRGTVAGSIAHADPAAELPAVLVVLGGEVMARSESGTRTIPAGRFFAGPLENSLAPQEWVAEVRFPTRHDLVGYAFEEFARRHGDYALCGVAAVVRPVAGDGVEVALSYLGVGEAPELLATKRASAEDLGDAVAEVVNDRLEPPDDIHASSRFRSHLARRLGERAARRALDATSEGP